MSPPPPRLEEPYRSTALAPGTSRYLSWLFAAPETRAALEGIFALMSEWRALSEPGGEPSVGSVKLGWWQEEIERLIGGRPLHPITRFLRSLPGADRVDFSALHGTLAAVDHELTAPSLDSTVALDAHAMALRGEPLALGSAFAAGSPPAAALRAAIAALATGEYLMLALEQFHPAARAGRTMFPSSELAAAGIAVSELLAASPGSALRTYLDSVRERAAERFAAVAALLPRPQHASQRHLLVLAAVERRRLYAGAPHGRRAVLGDLIAAWRTARRAARRR